LRKLEFKNEEEEWLEEINLPTPAINKYFNVANPNPLDQLKSLSTSPSF